MAMLFLLLQNFSLTAQLDASSLIHSNEMNKFSNENRLDIRVLKSDFAGLILELDIPLLKKLRAVM